MALLDKADKDRALDLMTERCVFERNTVALYDALLGRLRQGGASEMITQVEQYRHQEKEHEEWLEAQIRALGGDPHAETPMARLVKVESEGVQRVFQEGQRPIPELFHAMLVAELSDNAGWELLVSAAEEVDDQEAIREFTERREEEAEHLSFVQGVVETFACEALLGERVPEPLS
jgi:rubrerythrin